MKYVLLFSFFLISQYGYAQFLYNLEEAKKEALIGNKFILVYYQCNEYKPSNKLQKDCWDNEKILESTKSLVLLRVDVPINYYFERDNVKKRYSHNLETSIIHILDANGKIIDNLDYYENSCQITDLIKFYSMSTETLLEDFINYKRNNGFQNALIFFKKYCDFSLYADIKIKNKIINLAFQYLADAKNSIDKNDVDYQIKKQKVTILKMYDLAYEFNFNKLSKKLSKLNLDEVDKSNLFEYQFLKLLCSKGLNFDVSQMEKDLNNDGFEDAVTNSNIVYDCYKKTINK